LYQLGVITFMLINVLLAVSCWFIMTTGQVTLGMPVFAAIGGYVSAALIARYVWGHVELTDRHDHSRSDSFSDRIHHTQIKGILLHRCHSGARGSHQGCIWRMGDPFVGLVGL